ncbi:hypothetical protein CBS101457_003598 [Exobasidium rhododendri]|nr:hypothetical protein CBS101457_003598 [Exobasidium rhododendri]
MTDGEGPSELTLVFYSIFMAFSSLLFGGLSLWHARQGNQESVQAFGVGILTNVSSHVHRYAQLHRVALFRVASFFQSVDVRTFAWFISTMCLLVLVAYSTNPGDTSFRSYLTDLSLHQHLRQIHHVSHTPRNESDVDELEGATRNEVEKIASPHILNFANRISLSLRTPRYERLDYGLFSTVTVPTTSLNRASHSDQLHSSATHTRYVGAFGKWWLGGTIQSSRAGKQRVSRSSNDSAANSGGVLAMKAEDTSRGSDGTRLERASRKQNNRANGGASSKPQWSGFISEALQSQGGKPSGRRKKQAQKLRPTQALPGGEASVADRKPPDDVNLTITASSATDNPVFLQQQQQQKTPSEQYGPQAMTPVTISSTTVETVGDAAAMVEAQSQLDQLRLASETSRKQLQAQLDELRTRKRDEDAARLDVKGRMKSLDESKRQAEGTKREAEKRLKTATSLRESIETIIRTKEEETESWKMKDAEHEVRVQESRTGKAQKIEAARNEINERERESNEAEEEIRQLKIKLEKLQQRLLEEEANLEAARELAVERDNALVAAQRGYYPSSNSDSQFHNIYPLLSGPGEMLPDQSFVDLGMPNSTDHHQDDWLAQKGQNSNNITAFTPDPMLQFPTATTMTGRKGERNVDDKFDPTIAVTSHDTLVHPSFSPFSFDQSTFQNGRSGLTNQSSVQPPIGLFGDGSSMPISPFTSDLLPSNLFHNADDDERHVGVLPGSRSERVEAALNRFGLDSSDTSDLEGAVGSSTGKEEEARPSSFEDDDETPAEMANDRFSKQSARTWWGGRSRSGSKDRSVLSGGTLRDDRQTFAAAEASSDAQADVPLEGGKKRSLSIFPKLYLNPSAKSFRGPGKKSEANSSNNELAAIRSDYDGDDDQDRALQAAWSNSVGQFSTRQDFESMKRAFQTNNLNATQEDEDQGRRSWSAFDTWQQQQNHQPLSAVNTSNLTVGSRLKSKKPSSSSSQFDPLYLDNQRSSFDSKLQRQREAAALNHSTLTSNSSGNLNDGDSRTDWLDDVFLPLHKNKSIDAQSSSTVTTSSSSTTSLPQRQRVGKPSRFAFWSSNNNSSNVHHLPSSSSLTSSSSATGLAAGNDATPSVSMNAGATGPESTTPASSSSIGGGTPQSIKRSSFRWSRRQDSISEMSALNSNDKGKDQE